MSCQQLGDEYKLGIFCAPGSEVFWQICISLSPNPPNHPPPPPPTPWNFGKYWQKWRSLGKVLYTLKNTLDCHVSINYKYIKFKWLTVPKWLASYILYKYTFLKMYIPQPCAQRAHRNPATYIHPPSVGMIYPISTYIFKRHILPKLLASNIQSKYIFLKIPTLCPKGTQNPSNLHSSPKCWHDIFNTNI